MDRDEYEDYLVDKAKELLNESDEDAVNGVENDNRRKRRVADKEVEDQEKGLESAKQDVTNVRKEADVLARKRAGMTNDELEEFLSGESEFHKLMRNADKPDSSNFSDWENRVLITNPDESPEELADQLDRSVEEVTFQLKVLGLDQ